MDERVREAVQRREPRAEVMPTGWLTFGSLKVAWRDGDALNGAADRRRDANAEGW
jgi:hypothetical protein